MTFDPSTEFDRIISGSTIETAATLNIQTWFNTYAREVERQAGLDTNILVAPKTYTTRNTYNALPGEELPKCVVVSPGIVGTPQRFDRGRYKATWRLGVAIAISHKDEVVADAICKNNAAVIRALMVQKSNLGELGTKVEWVDETYNNLTIENRNFLFKSCSVFFNIDIEGVTTKLKGPTVPDLPPDSYDYGQATEVDVNLELEAVNG